MIFAVPNNSSTQNLLQSQAADNDRRHSGIAVVIGINQLAVLDGRTINL